MLYARDHILFRTRAKHPLLQEGGVNLYSFASEPLLVSEQTSSGRCVNQYWSECEPVLVVTATTIGCFSIPLQDASASLTPTHFRPTHLRWIIHRKVYTLHHIHYLPHSLIPSVIPEEYPQHRRIGISTFPLRAVQHPPHLPTYPQAYPRGMWTKARITSAWECVLYGACAGERGGIVVLLYQEVSHFN